MPAIIGAVLAGQGWRPWPAGRALPALQSHRQPKAPPECARTRSSEKVSYERMTSDGPCNPRGPGVTQPPYNDAPCDALASPG